MPLFLQLPYSPYAIVDIIADRPMQKTIVETARRKGTNDLHIAAVQHGIVRLIATKDDELPCFHSDPLVSVEKVRVGIGVEKDKSGHFVVHGFEQERFDVTDGRFRPEKACR